MQAFPFPDHRCVPIQSCVVVVVAVVVVVVDVD